MAFARGPWPTMPETLMAVHGDRWEIWRAQGLDGSHGDWIARRRDDADELRAATSEGLAVLLAGDT